jgi:riboflavin kinase/FMN adenylyltransferase
MEYEIIVKIFQGLQSLQPIPAPVVTIGTFDGVHLGHLQILRRLNQLASHNGGESVMITFYPHPRMVLYPDDQDLRLLNSQEEKTEKLREAGLQNLIVIPFTREFSRLSSLEFVRNILVNTLGMKNLVIGHDHHFGRNREGGFSDLIEYSPVYGFEVEEVPALELDEIPVSSSKIRHALASGNIALANIYLGYKYMLTGTVIKGEGRGHKLGFPTANIHPSFPYKLIPGNGVYAAQLSLEGQIFPAVVNIGTKPTFNGRSVAIEAHIPGFSGDLYGKDLTLFFENKIRNEEKFPSVDALRLQIAADVLSAMKMLEVT